MAYASQRVNVVLVERKRMKILVTGSSGQIGKELVKLLSVNELLLIDKKDGNNLNDDETLETIEKFAPEVVFHLAASFERTHESIDYDKANWEDNILATHNLLSVIGSCKHLIFASSYLVYDPRLYTNTGIVHLYEDAPTKPRNLCGASKLYLEKEIDFWADKHKATSSHARIFRVYSSDSQCFINHFHNTAKLGGAVNVWDTNGHFDFIHAKDVAGALYALFDAKVGGVYNVGTGIARSVADVISLTGVRTNQAVDTGYTERSCSANGKIKNLTGWSATIELKDGIASL